MGCGILYRMVAEQIGLSATLAMHKTEAFGFEVASRSRRLRANVRAIDANVAGGRTAATVATLPSSVLAAVSLLLALLLGRQRRRRRRTRRQPVEGCESSRNFADWLMRLCGDAFGPNGFPRLE